MHLYHLKPGTSYHLKLQHHVNVHGIDDLIFSKIKECKNEHLQYYEQVYISNLKPSLNSNRFASVINEKCRLARRIAMADISNEKNISTRGAVLCNEKTILALTRKEFIDDDRITLNYF